MTNNRFWCNQCRKEFRQDDVEQREIDTMWGDGRWWYCRTCGNKLRRYPEVGAREQEIILRVKQALAHLTQFEKSLPPDETCRLLLDMGQLYLGNGSYREAHRVFLLATQIAEQNDLLELAHSASELSGKMVYMFNLKDTAAVPLRTLFEQFMGYYIPQ